MTNLKHPNRSPNNLDGIDRVNACPQRARGTDRWPRRRNVGSSRVVPLLIAATTSLLCISASEAQATGDFDGPEVPAPARAGAPQDPYYGHPSPREMQAQKWAMCRSRYPTFNPRTGTFIGWDGQSHPCQ